MHPWGKWGRNFVEYGLAAARDALADAGLAWTRHPVRVRRRHHPQRLPRLHRRRHLRPGARLVGSPGVVAATPPARPGPTAINTARAQILAGLCDVALVVGADTTPKGFFAPVGGDRQDDPDWLRFRLLGATNPTYFALYARRRMELYGATDDDFAQVKVKNARHGLANPNARYRKEVTVDEVLASPIVADPLRLLEICATSDGGAALVLSQHGLRPAARRRRRRCGSSAVSTVTPALPQHGHRDAQLRHRLGAPAAAPRRSSFRDSIAAAAYEEAGIGPEDLDVAEVYDLSSALELDWYENIGLCKEGEAERLLRDGDTTLGGRIPVNPSGGLACFGEAIPAQAIAQVCELTWQLRGQADRPPGRGGHGRPHRQPGPVRPRLVRHRHHVAQEERCHARGLHRRCRPHAGRQAGRRPGRRPSRRPRRPRPEGARRPQRLRPRSPWRTCSSAASTPSARRPATSPAPAGWPPACPRRCPAPPIDRQCGSSQQALHFAAQAVMSGTNDVIIAGGVQNMSPIPIASAMTAAEPFGFADPFSRIGGVAGPLRRPGGLAVPSGAEMIAEKWAHHP